MSRFGAALAGLLMVAVALSGCTSDDAAGISVKAPADPVTEPYVFTAGGGGDSFVWNFGDGSPAAEGKTVEHVYGLANGQLTVELTVASGETSKTFSKKLVMGTGQNEAPDFVFEAATNWATVGESVVFSAANSVDPDGDPLRYQWICFYKGELLPAHGGHAHGGAPAEGVPFATSSAAGQPFTVATEPLPEPTLVAEGDFCDFFNGGSFMPESTVGGSFSKEGAYSITLLGRDPVNPSVAGEFTLFVTETRPDAVFVEGFAGSLQGGSGGQFQALGEQAGLGGEGPYDQVSHTFRLDLPSPTMYLNVSHDAGAAADDADSLSYSLHRDNTPLFVDQVGNQVYTDMAAGTYRITLTVTNALQVDYDVLVTSFLDLNPTHKYEAP